MSLNVTDYKWIDSRYPEKIRVGYYMDEFLALNMMGIPEYLKRSYDVVGIFSGHSKVRVGKSTIALQVAYFLAWLISGGRMAKDVSNNKWFICNKPSKKLRFSVEDNIVFTPEDLQIKARELYSRYGKNQVIVYDEGRAGLDSAAAMSVINKAMQDFFQECGQYGHVILIVLPNFFKLHEDYAISRSIFLIDVFTNKRLERGFFNFYNESQKEMLYIIGRKKTGIMSKYAGAKPSFTGRFSSFLPIDKEEYEKAKRDAIKQKEVKNVERKWKRQRDAALLLLYKEAGMSPSEIAEELTNITQSSITSNMVVYGIKAITGKRLDEIKEEATGILR